MNAYFPILARYNLLTNTAMYDTLSKLSPAKLNEEVGSYFGSIMGILNHVYGSDIIWLQRYRDRLPRKDSLSSGELDIQVTWPGADLFDDFAVLRTRREALDAVLVKFAGELEQANLDAVVDYRNSRGERKLYVLWQALMHTFNHQTHHRGQIAEILDQFGVTNDFSNLIATLSEPPVG